MNSKISVSKKKRVDEIIQENENSNIFNLKGRIGRKWFAVNFIILNITAIVLRLLPNIVIEIMKEIPSFQAWGIAIIFTALPVAIYLCVLLFFNLKKRVIDVKGTEKGTSSTTWWIFAFSFFTYGLGMILVFLYYVFKKGNYQKEAIGG